MSTPRQRLQSAVDGALAQFDLTGVSPEILQVVVATNPQFGDYQFNGSLPLAKHLRLKPRDIAAQIVAALDVAGVAETPEIAGAGFINFRLLPEFVSACATAALTDPRQGVPVTENKRKIVLDYPSPNVAKPLHVGHTRTTFIGDAVNRMLRFLGHEVISDNHIGDWGTPIGKVIVGWKKYRDEAAFETAALDEMGRLYALVNSQPELLDEARLETAKLQSGDPENLEIWETLRTASQRDLDKLYDRLDVHTDVTLGESFYNDRLASVIDKLVEKGIAVESQGALIIPFEEPEHLRDKPMLIRKSDGSALYATTDLATVEYRMETWAPDEMIYVVDVRQSDHFRQLFAATKKWDYKDVKLFHVSFGTILGDNGKPISTRDGVTSKLDLLLDEAERRAYEVAKEKNPELTHEELTEIARVLGIGAIKYADLSPNRTSDYQFSWEKMLALTGNSAVYLEYAYVRTRALRRQAEKRGIAWPESTEISLTEPAELDLAKHLLRFGEKLESALNDYRPHLLCEYLFETAQKFASFYDQCPILISEPPARESRMLLAQLTGDVLKRGLNLLGIEVIERM